MYGNIFRRKKAIENIQEFIENDEIQSVSVFDLKTALNFINKLQKENEMLKSKRQLEIDIAQEVLRWKGKYHLLSRRMEEEK